MEKAHKLQLEVESGLTLSEAEQQLKIISAKVKVGLFKQPQIVNEVDASLASDIINKLIKRSTAINNAQKSNRIP